MPDRVEIEAVGETREERAEYHRHAGCLNQQRGADHDEERRRCEYFRNAGLCRHPEHRPQQQSAADDEADQRSGHQGDLRDIDTRRLRGARAEQRQQSDEGDGGQVLEQQDRKSRATLTARQLLLFGEHLQHECGRRERQHQPQHNRRIDLESQQPGNRADRDRARHDLRCAETKYHAPHDPKARRLQLEANDEQQEHDAQFGEVQDVLGVVDEGEPERADDNAGREVAEYRSKAQPAA